MDSLLFLEPFTFNRSIDVGTETPVCSMRFTFGCATLQLNQMAYVVFVLTVIVFNLAAHCCSVLWWLQRGSTRSWRISRKIRLLLAVQVFFLFSHILLMFHLLCTCSGQLVFCLCELQLLFVSIHLFLDIIFFFLFFIHRGYMKRLFSLIIHMELSLFTIKEWY